MTDDLISKKALMKEFADFVRRSNNSDFAPTPTWNDAVSLVGSMPSAQPEQRWIPVTERLPNDDDWQLVTVLDESGDTPYRYSDFGWYLEAAECWIVNANQRTDIIAWMPIPKPWKGEDDE